MSKNESEQEMLKGDCEKGDVSSMMALHDCGEEKRGVVLPWKERE